MIFGKVVKKPYTAFNVEATDDFLVSENYKAFCDAAFIAHKTGNTKFFKKLSDVELVVLYVSCYLHEDYPLTAAYDDCVFNALSGRKHDKALMLSGNELLMDNLDADSIVWAFERRFPQNEEPLSLDEKREKVKKVMADSIKKGFAEK